jgi:hypothetical protein
MMALNMAVVRIGSTWSSPPVWICTGTRWHGECFFANQKRSLTMNDETTTIFEQAAAATVSVLAPESMDGTGAGDHDVPFSGYRPSYFTLRQRVRLLALRSEALDGRMGLGRFADDL